jgi:pimeloyl-ACP methyl ester carboxylesterase
MHIAGFADTNGMRLYYEADGSGHPLVLIHATGLDRRMWDGLFEAFAQDYHVVRYDLRGFGRSAPPTGEGYTHADDLKALLDYLAIPEAHVLGFCLGGGIAIDFAIQHPQSATALVVINTRLGGCTLQDPAVAEGFASVGVIGRKSGIEAARTHWLALDLFDCVRGKPDIFARLTEMISDYSGWHWMHDDPREDLSPPAVDRLHEIATPTLVVAGERDLPDWKRMCAIVAERVLGAQYVELPGTGHFPSLEDPVAFMETVLAFLASLPPPRR